MKTFLLFLPMMSSWALSSVPPKQHVAKDVAAALAACALMVASPSLSFASSTAAQISLDSLPPSSIDVQIKDLPVVGNLISGTYTKVNTLAEKKASVTITSPKNKVAAVKDIATAGHLEFDVGGFVNTHLDVDVALDEPGVATIKVASPLIPKLPLGKKNYGSKSSDWKMVTDLGNGASYYFNDKTGLTQYDKPSSL